VAIGRWYENLEIHCWYSDQNFGALEELEKE
jgi:hypothetical protein